MKHILIIYDRERGYASKVAEYVNTKDSFPFEARYFCEVSQLSLYQDRKNADIILAEEEVCEELGEYIMKDRLLLLTSNRPDRNDSSGRIYKYQSMDCIIKEILMYASSRQDLCNLVTRKQQMKMIGLFSPLGRSGMTTLGLALGEMLSKNHRTIYVDMTAYSNIDHMTGQEATMDLSDLMYAINNDSKDISALVGGASTSLFGLDILPSMKRHSDLICIGLHEWKQFLKQLENGTDYEYILLDLSEAIQGLMNIIGMCDRLIVTVPDDPSTDTELERFRSELSETVEDNEKTIYVYTSSLAKDTTETGGILPGIGDLQEKAKEVFNMLNA